MRWLFESNLNKMPEKNIVIDQQMLMLVNRVMSHQCHATTQQIIDTPKKINSKRINFKETVNSPISNSGIDEETNLIRYQKVNDTSVI